MRAKKNYISSFIFVLSCGVGGISQSHIRAARRTRSSPWTDWPSRSRSPQSDGLGSCCHWRSASQKQNWLCQQDISINTQLFLSRKWYFLFFSAHAQRNTTVHFVTNNFGGFYRLVTKAFFFFHYGPIYTWRRIWWWKFDEYSSTKNL